MRKILKIMILTLTILIFNSQVSNAATFSNMTYSEAQEYVEIEAQVIAESSKQAINLFKMVSSWDAYGFNSSIKNEDMKKYIEDTKENYSFLNNVKYNASKEIKNTFNLYIDLINEEFNSKGVDGLINGSIVFIDFLEKNMGNTQSNFLSFKKNGLTPFLNSYIYTNSNKIAINKILNGNSDEKVEGINTLKETNSKLNEVSKNETVPLVIRNYAKEYEQYYKEIINKTSFSNSHKFLKYEEIRVSGLFPLGVEFEVISDFQTYITIFSNFTDYPTLDLSLDLKTEKIKKILESIINQTPKTEEVQKLKKLHYEFIYELSQYEKTKDMDKLKNAYEDFYNKYIYLNYFSFRLGQRFGGVNASLVLQELSKLKEQVKCIDPNYESINNMNFNPNYKEDNNSYREFKIGGNTFFLSGIFSISYLIPIAALIIIVVIFKIVSKIKENSRVEYNYSDEDEDYY